MKLIYIIALAFLLHACQQGGEKQETSNTSPIVPESSSTAKPVDTPTAAPAIDSSGPEAAVQVIRKYYQAINQKDYAQAYQCWGDGGRESRQTYAQFVKGFANTDSVQLSTGEPGRIDAAAGSRYIEIPVSLRAYTKGGAIQRFQGKYVLRRAVVDGATAAQRSWHFYSADIHQQQ